MHLFFSPPVACKLATLFMQMVDKPTIKKIAPGYAIGYIPNEAWFSPIENSSILDEDFEEYEEKEEVKKIDGRRKVPKESENVIIRRIISGELYQTIADDYGLSVSRISKIAIKNGVAK